MSSIPGSQPDEPTDLGATGAEPAPDLAPQLPDDPGGTAAVTDELDDLADRPLAEHPEAYERIHARLQESLAGIDDA